MNIHVGGLTIHPLPKTLAAAERQIRQIPVRKRRFVTHRLGPFSMFHGWYEQGQSVQIYSRYFQWHVAPSWGQVWCAWYWEDYGLYIGWADGKFTINVI